MTDSNQKLRRVLLVDDSETTRTMLRTLLDGHAELEVVGLGSDGQQAVKLAGELRPDVIVMDVQMPVLDGLAATRAIMEIYPAPIVIVTSTLSAAEIDVALEAQRSGAVLALPKPAGPGAPSHDREVRRLTRMVRLMADVTVVRRRATSASGLIDTSEVEDTDPHPDRTRALPGVIGIAASTGGPAAIAEVINKLPQDFPVPIIVVQHIASGFAAGLARWLDGETEISVMVARDGEPLRPGVALIAPDDHHIEVGSGCRTVRILADPPLNGFRPSADRMFGSIAMRARGRAVGVVLTGMGDDGTRGLRALRGSGGYVIAQNKKSAVIWGMPGAAVQAGVTDETLDIREIGGALLDMVRRATD